MRNLTLVALVVGMGVDVGTCQQADSAAKTAAAPARIYDEGPDVVAPALLPMKRTIQDANACNKGIFDEVEITLVVDANGEPRDVTVINPFGTPLERLAQRIVEQDSFKPGTLKGEAVEVRLKALVSIEGCYATKKDANGNSSEVFRLKAQPVQTFGEKPKSESDLTQEEADKVKVAATQAYLAAAAGTPGLERVGNGVSAPIPLEPVEAEFSDEGRSKGVSGVCLIQMIVDTHGKPQNPRVVRAIGYGLDQKALEAVRKYHFKPAMKAGVPVPVMITVEVNFSYGNR